MSIITSKASSAITLSRFIFVITIVLLHSRIDQDIEPGIASYFIHYFCNFNTSNDFVCHLFHPSVPVLFILSGYLFFFNVEKLDTLTYRNKLKSRIKSLLLPFIIWTAFSILAKIFIYKEATFSLTYIIRSLTIDPLGVLWFIRDLMIIAIMSPMYFYITKILKLGGVLIIYLILEMLFPNQQSVWFNIYFLIGSAVAINKITIETILEKINYKLCLFIYFVYLSVTTVFQIDIQIPGKSAIMLIGVLGACMNVKQFKDGGFSTFLYFIHPYIKGIKVILIKFIPLSNDINCIIVLLARIIATIIISLFIYKLIPNKLRSILVGGR